VQLVGQKECEAGWMGIGMSGEIREVWRTIRRERYA